MRFRGKRKDFCNCGHHNKHHECDAEDVWCTKCQQEKRKAKSGYEQYYTCTDNINWDKYRAYYRS